MNETKERFLAVLLCAMVAGQPAWPGVISAAALPSGSPLSTQPSLFLSEALIPEALVSPSQPELEGGKPIKSAINFKLGQEAVLAQLHGRAAVSLAIEPPGVLTDDQRTYGEAHYNVEQAIDRITNILRPGVDAAIRRQLNLSAGEPLPADLAKRVVFAGVGGTGVKNPVAFIGSRLAKEYGLSYKPVRKIEDAKNAGQAELQLKKAKFLKGRTVIWIDNGVMSGRTFLESRRQLLKAGVKAVEPFFLGSAPGLGLEEIDWIVGSAAPAPNSFKKIVNSGRVPFTTWIDTFAHFRGDRQQAIRRFKETFGTLQSQAKLNVFFNTLERFKSRGLPEQHMLLWMAEIIGEDPALASLRDVSIKVAELITLRVQENYMGDRKDLHRDLFADLAALLQTHENRLPLNEAAGILGQMERRFQVTPAEVLKGHISDLAGDEGREVDRALVQEKVQALNGYGLNDVDNLLMDKYYKGSDAIKDKLQVVRDFLFARGNELVEKAFSNAGTPLPPPNETAAQAIERFIFTVKRWHQYSLAYGLAYKEENPNADEVNIHGDGEGFEGAGKNIEDEINQDTFGPLLDNLNTINSRVQLGKIRSDKVRLRLRRSDPPGKIGFEDRAAEVTVLPQKGDPWQIGHLVMMADAMAKHDQDVVVFTQDNSDPFRKPDLSSLVIRQAITNHFLKILSPFFQYSPIMLQEPDLRDKDGERTIFRFIALNRGLWIHWNYFAGGDHRHWDKLMKIEEKNMSAEELRSLAADTAMGRDNYDEKTYAEHYDTPRKESYWATVDKPDGYLGLEKEPLGVIINQRPGEMFEPGWREKLHELSGLAIKLTLQLVGSSSTRIRVYKHWWTSPFEVVMMASSIGFWGAEKACKVSESVMAELRKGRIPDARKGIDAESRAA